MLLTPASYRYLARKRQGTVACMHLFRTAVATPSTMFPMTCGGPQISIGNYNEFNLRTA